MCAIFSIIKILQITIQSSKFILSPPNKGETKSEIVDEHFFLIQECFSHFSMTVPEAVVT